MVCFYKSGVFSYINNMKILIRIITLCFLIILTGCNSEQKIDLVGRWISNSQNYVFNEDGTFVLTSRNGRRVGDYQIFETQGMIMLASTKNNVLNRIYSHFTLSTDGSQLALDRSFYGTVVMSRAR